MKNDVKAVDAATANSILAASTESENSSTPTSGNPSPAWDSQAPNNCSLPKSIENNSENTLHEKDAEEPYAARRQKCMHDLETQTGKALNMLYPTEYKTWSNSKNRSKKLKGITGPHWGTDLDTFPGFLRHAGPKPSTDDSLDRIDPSHGYVVGNIRWASKQLQSENRKNVETIMVRGMPMTKPQLAAFLGMTYNAFRMRLHRGDTVEDILNSHLQSEKPAIKTLAAKIEACPWPQGKEQTWEAAFKAERGRLLAPKDRDSRTAFFVAKCEQQFALIYNEGKLHEEDYCAGVAVPVEWQKKYEYWNHLSNFAASQRRLATPEEFSPPYSLEPTQEELDEMDAFLAPPDITDEDIHRQDW